MEHSPTRLPLAPFPTGETAWFWTVQHLQTSRVGRAPEASAAHRRAEAVLKCLDILYRNRRIELLHVRIMQFWGVRGVAPNPGRPRERSDWRIWQEALDRLDGALRARGIVDGTVLQDAAD